MNIDTKIEIVRQVLIAQYKYPEGDAEFQKQEIKSITKTFKQLLQTKARQERIQEISNDYCSSAENCGSSPADNASRGISIRDILQKKVAGHRKRNNGSRKKEGYVESRLGKHVTNGW
jgi:hypothetical protein